ncbi:MAG: hypothetical protein ACI9QL_000751 [Candidatus Omnitrophota bacterium]|jgi:hypothetical protein
MFILQGILGANMSLAAFTHHRLSSIRKTFIPIFFAGFTSCALAADKLTRIEGVFDAEVFASGFVTPDGLAIHPETKELYVTEEEAGRVSIIRDGKPFPVIEGGFTVVNDLPPWAFTDRKDYDYWMHGKLRNPEGLAFNRKGHLFITEDIANGRILEFVPDADGNYTKAHAIPIPWLDLPYGWESVHLAKDGRLFIAGSTTENGPGIFYGTVMMRDPAGDWWIVDYGPFASFSAVCLSADEEVLIVGEEVSGSLSWWDAVRHEEVGFVSEMIPNIEHVTVLPDGSILAAQESTMKLSDQVRGHDPRAKGGVLIRVNPQTHEVHRIAKGFGLIESVLVHPDTGDLYVTEDDSGDIIRLTAKVDFPSDQDLLARSVQSKELNEGRAPRRWPGFLKSFVKRLGFEPVDELPAYVGEGIMPNMSMSSEKITLEQFSQRIPLIAGKVKVTGVVLGEPKDAITELEFVIFYPNSVTGDRGYETPSLSLFTASQESGNQVQTQVMTGLTKGSFSFGEPATRNRPDNGILYIPMGFANSQPNGTGNQLTLSFMGIGLMDDYYLTLHSGVKESGRLIMEPKKGDPVHYDVTWLEYDEEGSAKRNLIIAGFDKSDESFGWHKLGRSPAPTLLSYSPNALPFVTRHTHEIRKLALEHEKEWKLAMGVGSEPHPFDLALAASQQAPVQHSEEMKFKPIVIENQVDVSANNPGADSVPPEDQKPVLKAESPDPERRAEGPSGIKSAGEPSIETIGPLVDNPPPGPTTWTNMLLSKAIEVWKIGTF